MKLHRKKYENYFLTFKEVPIFIKFFSSKLSNTGSNSSPTSWINNGRPIDTESSK